MKHVLLIATFLVSVTALAQPRPPMPPSSPVPAPPSTGGSCSAQELQSEAFRSEQATLDRVRRDMNVEGRVTESVLARDERECLNEAIRRVQNRRHQAIDDCVRQTTYFRTCEVQGHRVVQQPTRLAPISGNGRVDDYQTTGDQCRVNAQNQAIQNALASCQSTYGMACRIVSGPTPATYRTEVRRRYLIAGPKETYHICDSQASALPNSSDQVRCSVELFAKVRF